MCSLLACLQAVVQLAPQALVHLHTTAASPLPLLAAGCHSHSAQQQHMLWGLVKVAALDVPELQWSHSSALAQQPAAPAAAQLPLRDVYGPSLAAGSYLAPRLLAAPATPPAGTPVPATAGAIVITGGLGALGTLIAAQQLAGGGGSGQHLVLLGRSIQLGPLEQALGPAWRRASSASSAAMLTVSQVDSAAAADVAGLAHSLRGAGISVGTLIHSAGALKVCLGWGGVGSAA